MILMYFDVFCAFVVVVLPPPTPPGRYSLLWNHGFVQIQTKHRGFPMPWQLGILRVHGTNTWQNWWPQFVSAKKGIRKPKEITKKVSGFPKKTTTLFLTLSMEEIPNNHLGCIKPCKDWDRLPINWCRISSINSIFLWVHRGIAKYFSD